MEARRAGGLDFTAAEVKQLWWFNNGSIMEVETRRHLWRSFGLCARHAWGYAIVENEVRRGRPFSTAILYEDLARRAARLVGRRPWPWSRIRSRLTARGCCFTCDYLGGLPGGALTVDVEQWAEMAAQVNRRTRTARLVAEAAHAWRGAVCPDCAGGPGLPCRPHLLERDEAPPGLARSLEDLADRLERLVDSMTVRRTPIGPSERASWVEALGWFGGWDYVLELAAALERER